VFKSREFTCLFLDMVEQGAFDKDTLIKDLLGWMSEDEVKEFARANDIFIETMDSEEDLDTIDEEIDNIMDDFNYSGSRHHY